MQPGHVTIFGNRAWLVEVVGERDITVRQLAGPDDEKRRTLDVPHSMLAGRTIYRPTSELEDVDIVHAMASTRDLIQPNVLGPIPRNWADAFATRYAGRELPDATVMLGWFATFAEQIREDERHHAKTAKAAIKAKSRGKVATKNKTVSVAKATTKTSPSRSKVPPAASSKPRTKK